MAKIVGYIACSVDGFIADKNERLDWLNAYENIDYGENDYNKFIKTIGTVVCGRTTYDWIKKQVSVWPYADHNTIVVTSSPLPEPPDGVSVWNKGVDALVTHLRGLDSKDVWICGGGRLQSAFAERGALDFLEIYVAPVLIGDGVRLWPGSTTQTYLELDDVRHLSKGMIRMAYRRK